MTTILSFTCDAFSIILTDNRINHGPNQEFGYDDDHQKLFSLDNLMGWSSGTGLSEFLSDAKKELSKSEVKIIKDIGSIFEKVATTAKNIDPDMTEYIDNSVLVVSWWVIDENGIVFRVGMLCKEQFGSDVAFIEKDIIEIVYPGDYLNDQEKVESLLKKHSLKVEGNNLEVTLETMFRIFKDISKTSSQISTTCDLGILSFSRVGILKSKISGEIDTLIEALEKGTLGSFIEIIHEKDLHLK